MTHPASALHLIAHRFGPAAEVLRAETVALPPPGPGQVTVALIAASINPSDLISLSGAYAARIPLPLVGGYESVARVTAVGPDVTGLSMGQRVLPLGGPGAWASARVVQADWCLPVDDRLSDDQAATAYVNPLTCWLMLEGARPDTRLAVSAAASVIGRMILRLANRRGLCPTAILRSAASRDRLAGLDLADVIVSDHPAPQLARAWDGRGPDLALDCVGGATGQGMLDALCPGGQMIHYGLLSGQPLGVTQPLRRDIRFTLFALRNWVHAHPRADLAALLDQVTPFILDGTLATPVIDRLPLSDIGAALTRLAVPGRDGKILLVPDPCR